MSELEQKQPEQKQVCEGHTIVVPPQIWEYCQKMAGEKNSTALGELNRIVDSGLSLDILRKKGFPVTVHLPSGDQSLDNYLDEAFKKKSS